MQLYLKNKQLDFIEGEVIPVNKPYKWTSFDVVNKIRTLIKFASGIKTKTGHSGTLDPLATGLLIICTGKLTKKLKEFQDLEKEYTGTITLGATTPSFDLETEIDETFDISHINAQQIIKTTKNFIGNIQQTPPCFSAKKINGKRAYKYARNKEKITLKPINITINKFEITNINLPNVDFKVVCSKGTYIRSLAYDFGKALTNGAYLSSLCRTRIGNIKLENAFEIKDIKQKIENTYHLKKNI